MQLLLVSPFLRRLCLTLSLCDCMMSDSLRSDCELTAIFFTLLRFEYVVTLRQRSTQIGGGGGVELGGGRKDKGKCFSAHPSLALAASSLSLLNSRS